MSEVQCNDKKSSKVNGNQSNRGEAVKMPCESASLEEIMQSVLHILEQHWRRYERDRMYWEMERADLQARIIALFKNIKRLVRD